MATSGIMAKNNFVSQSELLAWLNSTLALKLEKIEDTCSGAVACQLFDALHGPGTINMKRVDFNVKSDYEFVQNYKELQKGFVKHRVDRAFHVAQLSKGKRQDNMEFMQWMYGYWGETVANGGGMVEGYDAVGRRERLCKTGDWKKFSTGVSGPVRVAGTAATAARSQAEPAPLVPLVPSAPSAPSAKKSVALGTKHAVSAVATTGSAGIKAHHGGVDPELLEKERQEKASLLSEVTELKLKIDTAERERDFYFDKLRQIEIMCQAPELADEKVLRVVESVLYAADAEEARKIMVEAEGTLGVHLVPEEEGGVGGDVAGDVGSHVEAVEAFLTSE